MRQFSYITTGKILEILKNEGIKIGRATYYKLEKEGFFMSKKSSGRWRVYTPKEAAIIVEVIKDNFNLKKGGE